jgi:hypothetical protein
MQQRIDLHCHAVAPGYRQYAIDNGHEKPDGMPALPVRGQFISRGFHVHAPLITNTGSYT